MPISLTILNIIGAVCILLWGTQMVRRGFTRAYGHNIQQILHAGTKSRIRAFFSGLGVTALLQSSTATALLLTSFARKKLIPLAASLAVIIGADISTTLVAQILSFDLSWISPALIFTGYIVFKAAKGEGRQRHISRILIGLGFMLLALTLIRSAAAPIKESDVLPLILAPLNKDPLITILIAAFLTWVMHSSLATVLLFASLAASGIIDLPLGILLVLGANLGGAFIPLAVTWKDGSAARRITCGNLIMRLLTLAFVLPFLHQIPEWLSLISEETSRQVVHMHTAFNVVLALIFLPLTQTIAQVCEKLFKDTPQDKKGVQPLYLDQSVMDSPVIALSGAARETLHMAEIVQKMLENTIKTFEFGDEQLVKRVRIADNDVDRLYRAVKLYIAELSQNGMDPKEADRSIQILTFATNLEHIGDIIDKSLMELAEKKIRKKEGFSKEGFAEIKSFHDRVLENFRLSQAIFMSEDVKLANKLVASKNTIRLEAEQSAEKHFKRLSEGHTQTLATSSLHLDIIRDYRRINSYATRVAYTILETKNEI